MSETLVRRHAPLVGDRLLVDFQDRLKRYRAIEAHRGRPIIAYATSTRQGLRVMMAGDAVRELIDQVDAIPAGSTEVDVLLHSTGGDALAAWKLMSVLRERFSKVGVLVPFAAFSAATVFALGADEIVMHPHASLGPIDPQILLRLPDGNMRQFAYEDLTAYLKFLGDEVGITEQVHKTTVVDRLFTSVDPVVVGGAKRASDLASAVGARLLSMHEKDERRAKQIATNLNKSFFAHGDAVSRTRARELELNVAPSDPKLEALIWDAYLGLESSMELRKPFVALSHFMSEPAAEASLKMPAALEIPSNAPEQLALQMWQAAAQRGLGAAQAKAPEVPFEWLNAVIESPRCRSENRTTGYVQAWRQPNGMIQVNLVEKEANWRTFNTVESTQEPATEGDKGATL